MALKNIIQLYETKVDEKEKTKVLGMQTLDTPPKGFLSYQEAVDTFNPQPGDTIFVGQDDVTVGVLIGISQKTMRSDFNVNFIMDFMQNSTWIAQNRSSDTFKISQMPGDNTFIGSYQKPGNPFIYQSFFPVMVVNGNLIDENKDVYIGRLTKLDNKGEIRENKGVDKEFWISQSDLRKMVNSSNKKFETIDPFVLVSDITQSMFKRFKYNFPVPIYGLFDDRKA